MRLVFWMNMPSFYQSDLFRSLARQSGVDLKVYFAGRIPGERAKLGWQDDLAGFDYEFLDGRRKVTSAVVKALKGNRGSINVVGGLWAGRVPESVLATLYLSGSRYYIYSEAPDPRINPSRTKSAVLLALGRPIVRRAEGVLAISHFAREYFKAYGIDESRIIPFGYFRSLPKNIFLHSSRDARSGVDVVFVGQLIDRKGVDVLLSAMETLFARYEGLRLRLIGTGELEGEYRRWVDEKGLAGRIIFEGAVASSEVMAAVSKADLLVLPSRWDGWGIVVNEALMAGVPVVVSNMCGAADLIRDGVNGYVFRSEDPDDLRRLMESIMTDLASGVSCKSGAGKTGEYIGAENAAKYLLDIAFTKPAREYDAEKYPWAQKINNGGTFRIGD